MDAGKLNPRCLIRRLRFRLRTLLALTTLACAALGFFAYEVQQAKRARLLLKSLPALSGSIPLYEPRTVLGIPADKLPYWKQLADWLEEPFLYQRIDFAHLDADRITDAELSDVADLLPSDNLNVAHSRLSDIGMSHLARMPLKTLWLCDLDVSPTGFARLSAAKSLERLLVHGHNVTDAHLAHAADLQRVHEIQLVDTSTTEVGLQHVAKMPSLRYLFIATQKLSDAQIDVIAGMHWLERLDLCDVGLTDQRLASLARLPNLNSLMLYNNPITTAGLAPLERLKYLDTLDIRSTHISDDGIPALLRLSGLKSLEFNLENNLSAQARKQLRRQLPKCIITIQTPNNPGIGTPFVPRTARNRNR